MFFTIYEELCRKRGETPSCVAVKLGINKGTVTRWKKEGKTPKSETLKKIADYFYVSTDYLLGKEEELSEEDIIQNELFEKRKVLFDKSSKASVEQLNTIIKLIDQLTNN